MSDQVRGSGDFKVPNSHDMEVYRQEYAHGLDLFKRALEEHSKAENMYQKDAFKKVMDQSMTILNDAARELKKDGVSKQNEKIAADYLAYQHNPGGAQKAKLLQDLEKASRHPG